MFINIIKKEPKYWLNKMLRKCYYNYSIKKIDSLLQFLFESQSKKRIKINFVKNWFYVNNFPWLFLKEIFTFELPEIKQYPIFFQKSPLKWKLKYFHCFKRRWQTKKNTHIHQHFVHNIVLFSNNNYCIGTYLYDTPNW